MTASPRRLPYWLYRPLMRLAHRFDWHCMEPAYPDGDTMLWCHWCGIRIVVKRAIAAVGEQHAKG